MRRTGSGRRAGQRFDAEHRVVTEALIFLGQLDPESIGPNLEHATHYEATPPGDVARLLAAAALDVERTTFVDAGSGMGRVVLIAARSPFKQVVGVEISAALHEVAVENLAVAGAAGRRCRDTRLVRADAATYAFPRGDLAVYLYNPFGPPVLGAVVDRLLARRPQRELTIIYHTPVHRAVIEETRRFALVADLGYGVVYRLSA
jgi:SAM-dependent methyltransferase